MTGIMVIVRLAIIFKLMVCNNALLLPAEPPQVALLTSVCVTESRGFVVGRRTSTLPQL